MTQKQLLSWALCGVLSAGGIGYLAYPVAVRAAEGAEKHEGKDKEDEKEEKIAVDKLPAAVVEGIKTAMPDGKITDAEKEQKDGKTVYELDVTSGGKTYEVVVGEDGKVISKKEEEADKDEKGEHKN